MCNVGVTIVREGAYTKPPSRMCVVRLVLPRLGRVGFDNIVGKE